MAAVAYSVLGNLTSVPKAVPVGLAEAAGEASTAVVAVVMALRYFGFISED
jgi:hypothetical protein